MDGGEHCTQRNRWLSSRLSLSSLGVQAPPPPHIHTRKLSLVLSFFLGGPKALCLTWALRKGGLLWPCRECGSKTTVTLPHSTWGCVPGVPCVGLGLSVVSSLSDGSSQPHPRTQRVGAVWGQ